MRRALEGICTQSYRNLEIICVDDGSTDDSADILREYAAKDSRILLISQPNRGLAAARNAGIDVATGEWIAGVDPDDYLRPEAYATLIPHATAEVDLVCFGRDTEAEPGSGLEGHVEASRKWARCPYEGLRELDAGLLTVLRWNFYTKLYRRSLMVEHGLRLDDSNYGCEDLEFHMRYCAYAKKAYIEPRELYVYYLRKGSIMQSSAKSERRLTSLLNAFSNIAGLYCKLGVTNSYVSLLAFLFRVVDSGICNSVDSPQELMLWRGCFLYVIKECHLLEYEEFKKAMLTANMEGMPVTLLREARDGQPGNGGSWDENVQSALMLMDVNLMREWMFVHPLTPKQIKQVLAEPLTPSHVKQVLAEPLTPRHVKQVLAEPLTPRHVKQVQAEPLTAQHVEQVRGALLQQKPLTELRARLAAMEAAEQCGVCRIRLLGFLPLLKIERSVARTRVLLFHVLPLLTVRHERGETIYHLFGVLQLLRRSWRHY